MSGQQLGAPFAAALDGFLANVFVPTFRKALKRRGVIVPEAPPEVVAAAAPAAVAGEPPPEAGEAVA